MFITFFLFSMYINDIEDEFYLHGIDGIEIDSIKTFHCFILMILYFQKLRKDYKTV